jgi:photosynthetic reaction center cytochrome c subunit
MPMKSSYRAATKDFLLFKFVVQCRLRFNKLYQYLLPLRQDSYTENGYRMRRKRRVALGITAITFGLALLVSLSNWKTQAQQQQPAQGDPPVEQKHPNVQVLKGMPESQLIPVMQLISASLGVNCAYCHVNNQGKWEFEKDDKKTKLTARRMIQMTFDINKGNRDILGGTGVSCFTCHRGAAVPVSVPLLPVPAEGGAGAGAQSKPTADTLPTAAQVVDKYLQAVGGRAAADRIKTRVMKGALIGSDGKEMPFEARLQSPDKLLTVITGPQGVVTQALTGTTGWIKTPKEQRELRAPEITRFGAVAQTFDPIQVKEAAPDMRVAGREKVGDRDAIVVVWPLDESRSRRLYFDAQTGLLLRSVTYVSTVLGRVPSQVDFEDYRDVDGVKLPFTIRLSSVDSRNDTTRRFTEIKANVPVDNAQFTLPPAQK